MRTSITFAESRAQTDALGARICRAEDARDWEAAAAAYRDALAHPCAQHAFSVPELWTGLAGIYRMLRDYDAAIGAMESAITAGHQSWPDPRADIAELHLLAGRPAEAAALLEQLRAEAPEDIWLYNAAGFAYAGVEDHEAAVRWFAEGIALGLATGDPEGVIAQLNEERTASLIACGREPDELTAKAEAFVQSWTPPSPGSWSPPAYRGEGPPPESACEHCGYVADVADVADEPGDEFLAPLAGGRPLRLGVTWFPPDQWAEALRRWPDLGVQTTDHTAYSRKLQGYLLTIAELLPGRSPAVAPIEIDAYLCWCDEQGVPPEAAESRARYGTEAVATGRVLAWPPGRNESCWCGSGRKYKKCCGTVTAQSR